MKVCDKCKKEVDNNQKVKFGQGNDTIIELDFCQSCFHKAYKYITGKNYFETLAEEW